MVPAIAFGCNGVSVPLNTSPQFVALPPWLANEPPGGFEYRKPRGDPLLRKPPPPKRVSTMRHGLIGTNTRSDVVWPSALGTTPRFSATSRRARDTVDTIPAKPSAGDAAARFWSVDAGNIERARPNVSGHDFGSAPKRSAAGCHRARIVSINCSFCAEVVAPASRFHSVA